MKHLLFALFVVTCLNIKLVSQANCNTDWRIDTFKVTSTVTNHPSITLTVDPGYKILGGGASLNFDGGPGKPGALLTESYPLSETQWVASGKDHGGQFPFKTSISAYAIAIYDPNNCWDIKIDTEMKEKSSTPSSEVTLSDGYIMTGGGGRIIYSGLGNLMVSSYPSDNRTWKVTGKDHYAGICPAYAASYIIGIKPVPGNNNYIENVVSSGIGKYSRNLLSGEKKLDSGYIITGGGSLTTYDGPGILIYKSYPNFRRNTWVAFCKAHGDEDSGIVKTFVVGLKVIKL